MQMKRIRHGGSIQNSTKQKLAEALKCSIGDINNALADTPHPLRKEADKREGEHKVPIDMDRAKMKPMPEEEYVPVLELPKPNASFLENGWGNYVNEDKDDDFKEELKELIIKKFLETESVLVSDAFKEIGKEVARRVLGYEVE